MLWINFLHLYQPANADGHVIKEATEKSYLRILRALEEHPGIKFTLNINGCLFLRWEELNYLELIRRIGRLMKRKQIEITGNAAYHPLLPLIPEKEAIEQIRESEAIFRKFLGPELGADFKPNGFFSSEMAYSRNTAKIIKSLGYDWLILDEISLEGLSSTEKSQVFIDEASGLKVILRDRKVSQTYVPKKIEELFERDSKRVIITGTDGEIYGLRHEDPSAEFEKLLGKPGLETELISAYIENKVTTTASFRNSSWETSEKDIQADRPYVLWSDPRNLIQQKLWELARLAEDTVETFQHDSNFGWARWHLVRGLESCTFWWASGRDLKLFAPISWSPDEIERGINEFIRAIRALDDEATRPIKMKAERLHIKIKQMIWEQHWTYFWKRKTQ